MAIEIEAKIRVADLAGVAARLGELGAQAQGTVSQRDVFFDTAEGELRAGDVGLRVREESGGDGVEMTMCYKGPRRQGRYKDREEIEMVVGDGRQGQALLEALGFEATLTVEKQREVWRWQECEVCLDEVQQLGAFVEIEGPSEEQVGKVLAALGLEDTDHISTSYVSMLAEKLQEQG